MTLKELNNYKHLLSKADVLDKKLQFGRGSDQDKKELFKIKRNIRNITAFIHKCPDPFIREIMICRFIDALSWDMVATRVGGGISTADSCRMLTSRYLKRLKQ